MPSRNYIGPIIAAFLDQAGESVATPLRTSGYDHQEHMSMAYDGFGNLWSYEVCLATFTNSGILVINGHAYKSITTSIQRQRLIHAAEERQLDWVVVDPIRTRPNPYHLLDAYLPERDFGRETTQEHNIGCMDVRAIERLKREARRAAKHQHHKLGNFRRVSPFIQRAVCTECAMDVDVNIRPAPNQTDISGPAIEQVCNHNDNKE
jgi:hypothetical protein